MNQKEKFAILASDSASLTMNSVLNYEYPLRHDFQIHIWTSRVALWEKKKKRKLKNFKKWGERA